MPRRKKTKTERFLETARRQFQRSCIPAATAVCVSVGITKLGVPAIPLLLAGGAGIAYSKGYRLRIVQRIDDEESAQSIQTVPKNPESSAKRRTD